MTKVRTLNRSHNPSGTAGRPASRGDRRTIVFLGTHGQQNIGDELLLETFLRQLGPHHRYVINTYDKQWTSRQLEGRYDVELIDTAADRRALLRHLRRCDLLCFGGGSIVKELYKSTGRNRYSTLLMILATVTFTKWIARKPIGMFNIGVGPITTRRGRWLARAILVQVDELSVRDRCSYDTCRRIGLGPNAVSLRTDAVFSSEVDGLLEAPRPPMESREGRLLRVALNLNYDIENPANWELFLDRLAAALGEVNRRYPLELHALPMQSAFKANNDAEVLREFATRLPDVPMVQHHPLTHTDAATIIASCDLLVSERLHAIVMASIIRVPSFALAYDVKVRELCSILGLESQTVDINLPFEQDELTTPLLDLIERLDASADAVAERCIEQAQIASEGFDEARQWVQRSVAVD